MGGYKQIKPRWKKGESGNPKGRPKKLFKQLADELSKEGYERVTAQQVRESIEMILGLDEQALKRIQADPDQPVLFKILIKGMAGKRGVETIEKMLDRVHGRPTQVNELRGDEGSPIAINIVMKDDQ